MRVIIDHPHSKSRKLNQDDGLLWDQIEDFLTLNKYIYAQMEPEVGAHDGLIVWLPDVGPRSHKYPKKDEDIRQISDLAKFLFEDLKLTKNCLHFVFSEHCINGEGKTEECWESEPLAEVG